MRRKTRIAPRNGDKFDIDVLVIMGSFYNWLPVGSGEGITPQKALNALYSTVTQSDRYGSLSPQQVPPTITMTYADQMNVEVVPVYVDRIGASPNGSTHSPVGRAYWVPVNGKWELADYDYEADYISVANDAADGWLVPTIKMLKAIKRVYFVGMKSFHLDILATAIIPVIISTRQQAGESVSYAGLISDFFWHAQQYLTTFTRIPGSHSPAIALTEVDTLFIRDAFAKIHNYIDTFSKLSETEQVKGWKLLIGDPFPNS